MPRIKKVLIANRGEIALRVMRTCKELNLATVAVFSDADRSAPHARFADEAVYIGPSPSKESYLVQEKILAAAKSTGADAIHPGYGFLSENPTFARACVDANITFIGPPASAMEAMGEKTRARINMQKAGVPVVPGALTPFETLADAQAFAADIGYPVMLKAAGGGGGKGMRRVDTAGDLESAWRMAKSESLNAFGNDALYLEKFVDGPHHIEIQVFADMHGNCIHLNERECSAQRRNQKVVEEAPSPILTEPLRKAMGLVAVKAAKAVGYVGAGTIEFLVDSARNFYFLEMNTRLQVEHPVTEWICGVDLVAWQIHVAQGGELPLLETPAPNGHSIEVRVYAENPERNFMPSPGRIAGLQVPSGPFIRDDSGVVQGFVVPNTYDPMISKLSVWAPTRAEAIRRCQRALEEYGVQGITTNVDYLKRVLAHPDFMRGDYDTSFLPKAHTQLTASTSNDESQAMLAAALYAHLSQGKTASASSAPVATATESRWRTGSIRSWSDA